MINTIAVRQAIKKFGFVFYISASGLSCIKHKRIWIRFFILNNNCLSEGSDLSWHIVALFWAQDFTVIEASFLSYWGLMLNHSQAPHVLSVSNFILVHFKAQPFFLTVHGLALWFMEGRLLFLIPCLLQGRPVSTDTMFCLSCSMVNWGESGHVNANDHGHR